MAFGIIQALGILIGVLLIGIVLAQVIRRSVKSGRRQSGGGDSLDIREE